MSDLEGKTLDHYRVLSLLGQGAMARVYRARDLESGAEVAIKVLHPHLTSEPEVAARFEHEARAASELKHPAIVRVLDHGRVGNIAYLVMPLHQGPSLKEYLKEREGQPIPIAEAVSLAARLADALDYAHRHGVVHRDVKPSNVLLPDGDLREAMIADFGIAHLTEATVETASGTTLGTPAYMAPEQGAGTPADARSDVYSLGAMLFEVVTGQPPFRAESPYAVIMHHIHTPPPSLRSLRPDLPPAVESVILRALAKEPANRYATAADFATALRNSLASPMRPRRDRLPVLTLAAVVVLILGGALTWRAGLVSLGRFGGAVAANVTPTMQTLILQGAPAIRGAWLDPDLPNRSAVEDPKVHLQGPSTPDRIAYSLVLPEFPEGTEIVTATLSLYTVPWGEENRYATVALHRILRQWDPGTATYESPWARPGLSPDVDYEAEPFLTRELSDRLRTEGWLELNITDVVRDWFAGEPNYGILLHMTDDSFGMAHLWVYTSEYDDPDFRPKLTLAYEQ